MPDIENGIVLNETPQDIKAYFPLVVGQSYLLQNRSKSAMFIVESAGAIDVSAVRPRHVLPSATIGVEVGAKKVWGWTEEKTEAWIAVSDA